jgi:hypothetical protein
MRGVNRWRNTLAAASLLLGLHLHAAGQTPIVDISESGGPWVTTNGALAELSWDYHVMNNANIATNWMEFCTQVKLYDIYSVTNPVQLYVGPGWSMDVIPGTATNLWDVRLTCSESDYYLHWDGGFVNFSIAAFIPTNAVGELMIGERRGQGQLQDHLWQPGGPSVNRTGGDVYLGPVGLVETAMAGVEAVGAAGAGGPVGLRVRLRALTSNAVEYSATLAPVSWSNLMSLVNATTSELTTNLPAVHAPGDRGFYRVRSWR